MILLFVVAVFLSTVFLGIPLVWAILITAVLPIIVFDLGYPLQALFLNFIGGVEPNHFLAIPLFIVAGEMMSRGGVGLRIIGFARAAFGFMAGGLGMVVVGASMIFGGISGSAIADSAAIGSVMIKNMSREGYDKAFAAGLVAAAGTIGIIIPPSIPNAYLRLCRKCLGRRPFHWRYGARHSVRRVLHGRLLLRRKNNKLRPGRPDDNPEGADLFVHRNGTGALYAGF
jgi:TRAP-type mannitol/chloroaromatic compound transport system permease large subunit